MQVLSNAKAIALDDPSSELFVVDETNLLAPSTEKYLAGLLKKLQDDTGLKLRTNLRPSELPHRAWINYLCS